MALPVPRLGIIGGNNAPTQVIADGAPAPILLADKSDFDALASRATEHLDLSRSGYLHEGVERIADVQ